MARIGKIARLAVEIREQLNQKLHNGKPSSAVLDWLNRVAEVQSTLKLWFKGVPISEQNLSEWRHGGYQDWLRREEACGFLREMEEDSYSFFKAGEEQHVSELLAARVSIEFARVAQALLAEAADPKERWQRLKELLPLLAQLRRADNRAAHLAIKKEDMGWTTDKHDAQELLRELWSNQRMEDPESEVMARLTAGAIKPNQSKSNQKNIRRGGMYMDVKSAHNFFFEFAPSVDCPRRERLSRRNLLDSNRLKTKRAIENWPGS